MYKRPYIPYNFYFLIPFLLWIIGGAILLLLRDKQYLFAIVNVHHTSALDVFMYYTTWVGQGVIITIVLLVLLGIASLRNWWYFIMSVMCNVVPALACQQIKFIFHAPRPLNYFHKATWIHFNNDWPILLDNSFPSGHTTGAFSFFYFLTLLLPDKYKKWGAVFFVAALLVGYSRMYLAAHFFADVYVGSIIGTVLPLVIIYLMRPFQRYFFKKDLSTTPDI